MQDFKKKVPYACETLFCQNKNYLSFLEESFEPRNKRSQGCCLLVLFVLLIKILAQGSILSRAVL